MRRQEEPATHLASFFDRIPYFGSVPVANSKCLWPRMSASASGAKRYESGRVGNLHLAKLRSGTFA